MTVPLKLLTALPLVALMSACVAGGNNTVDSQSDLEASLDSDIDGDGTVPQNGVEVSN